MTQLDQILSSLPEPGKTELITLFQGLPKPLVERIHYKNVRAGGVIVRRGDPAVQVYLLLEGQVQVLNEQENGEVYTFAEFSAPEFLGEFEALSQCDFYRGTITALCPCRFLLLHRDLFLTWMQTDVKALFNRTQHITKRLVVQASSERSFLFLSGTQRLLLHLAQQYEKTPFPPLLIRETRQQLADGIGFCVKTVNRSIQTLAGQGLLSLERGKIVINAPQYREICGIIGNIRKEIKDL